MSHESQKDGRGESGEPLALHADACVVGSGGGGAVAGAELARGGLDVVLLEQGPHFTSRDFDQREDTMLPRLFEEGGMRATEDGSITVLQGRRVGGSTVHNLCYAFRTPEPILALWREEHALPSLRSEALAESFERVERMLRVKPIREDEVNALNRVVRAGAEKLGYSGFVTRHNREGCVQSGYCILGCSYGAKYIDDPASCGEWAARRFALQCVSFDGRMLADGACRVAGMGLNGVKEKLGHR